MSFVRASYWVAPALLLVFCSSSASFAQDRPRKQAQAVRIAADAIRVDGRLDDEGWRNAPPITDFVQKEPDEGAPATDRIEVRFAYDGDALYVGARMYSGAPIQAPMGRRDSGDQAEHILVSLDTYLDRRTASSFGVTAAGVRLDEYFPQDDQDGDEGFNPVWQARTTMDADGWSAELWIPFSQLRFNDRSPHVWGLNVKRWIPTRNEEVLWELVGRTEQQWASLFGDLQGIDGIRPSRRLELLPYVASASHLVGNRDPGDPFTGGANLEGRVGLDMKVGLGSNLTLEATANPDFGQVEADPAEVNLSAFETQFPERRPFFLDGNQLLIGNLNNYYYSRRIGGPPAGRASEAFVEYPATTTIIGATKLTGRLPSGTSLGILGAVTAGESARTFSSTGVFGRTRIAPRTTYGVARVQQEWGPPGSTVAFMATGVHRDFEPADPLAALLARKAITLSSDSLFRLKDGEYQLLVYAGITHVAGAASALDRVQRHSARYLQRPDADYVHYDPLRESMTGGKSGWLLERRNGRHWLWQAEGLYESPEFEPADMGRITTGDGIQTRGEIEYRETVPGAWWRAYSFRLGTNHESNYGWDRQSNSITPTVGVTWPNFWVTEFEVEFNGRAQDMRLTRGGPLMERPRGWQSQLEIETSDASRTRGELEVTYGRDEDGGLEFMTEGAVTVQPGQRWELSVRPSYERTVGTQQYLATLDGGLPATFGRRYLFGHIDRSTYSTQLRLNYTFKPDLNLDFYGEPFAASGRYSHVGELILPRTRETRAGTFAAVGLPSDFNVQSFRSNLVLRWEWRPGSTLYLVWQQDRASEIFGPGRASVADMFGSLGNPGDHFFAIKASFWLSPR